MHDYNFFTISKQSPYVPHMYNSYLGYQNQYQKCKHLSGFSRRSCLKRSNFYRLIDTKSDNPYKGILTGVVVGLRGTVCNDGFGMDEGHAACKTLGYAGAVSVSHAGSDAGTYNNGDNNGKH